MKTKKGGKAMTPPLWSISGVIEPPEVFLQRLLLFCTPGLICGLAGFLLLSSPYYRPHLGAALYFLGMALVICGAFLAV